MTAFFVLLFLALGAVAGTVHFMAIARDAELLVHGGSALLTLGLRLGRLLLTASVLIVAARHGWPALFATAIGILIARQVVMVRLRAPT